MLGGVPEARSGMAPEATGRVDLAAVRCLSPVEALAVLTQEPQETHERGDVFEVKARNIAASAIASDSPLREQFTEAIAKRLMGERTQRAGSRAPRTSSVQQTKPLVFSGGLFRIARNERGHGR